MWQLFDDTAGNVIIALLWTGLVLVATYWIVRKAISDEARRDRK